MSKDKTKVRQLLDAVKASGRTSLTAPEGKQVCDAYGIAVPGEGVAKSAAEAGKLASGMGFPFRYGINSMLLNDRGRRFADAEFVLGIEPRRDGRTYTRWFDVNCPDGAGIGPLPPVRELCRGATGTITVMGRVGHASCARAGTGQSDGAAEAASRPSMARRGSGKAVAEARMAGSRVRRLIRP